MCNLMGIPVPKRYLQRSQDPDFDPSMWALELAKIDPTQGTHG